MDNNKFNLEEKEIYKLFNDVRIDENEFNKTDEKVSMIQREKIKKRLKKELKGKKQINKAKYATIAAGISLVCLIGISTSSQTFAKDIPILNSIIQSINDKFGNHGEYAKFSEVVNKSITDSGITLTINEALADDSKLMIGYTIKSNKKIKDLQMFGLSRFMHLNGKEIESSNGSSAGNYEDEYTYIGTEEIHTDSIKKYDNLNLDFKIDDILGMKGNWNFAFRISKKEIKKQSKIFNPKNKIYFKDSIVTVDKVICSPIDTSIFISGDYKSKNSKPYSAMLEYDYWLAFDDKGTQLKTQTLGGGSSSLNKHPNFHCEMQYERLKNIPKYLTIIPCKINPSVEGHVGSDGKMIVKKGKPVKEISKSIDSAYPIKLPQGNFGKIIVKKIKLDNNKTTVNFIAEGKAPYFQATELYIKDNNGKRVDYKNYDIKRSNKNPNEFSIDFEALDKNKKYSIVTTSLENVQFGEDFKFNIKLK